ncbi:MAG: prepilin-type N-terminal cleavage/methylation domain-containing protein [Phycisphaerales bacterium]|nr:MAG: prepilin-type N-terminal cleavage/methylation domain-containing protein [Phycisphaerales bacterium]
MDHKRGFTMVELMVVVLIVGILAAVAVPLMSGRIDASKWSEGKAAMGTIASGLRAYAAEKGTFAAAPTLLEIGISNNDLDGTYFSNEAYEITSASASAGQVSFVITCTAANSTRPDKPSSPSVVTLTSNAANSYVATFAETP